MTYKYVTVDEKIRKNNILGIVADEKHNEELKHLHHYASFKRDLYEKGEEWYNNGFKLEDASDELRNNSSFIDGYKRGERLAYMEQLKNFNHSGKSR